jgi:hypothetical protein
VGEQNAVLQATMSISEKNSAIEGDQDHQVSVEDHRLLRKVDRRLLPIFTLLYLLSFLDRFVLFLIAAL